MDIKELRKQIEVKNPGIKRKVEKDLAFQISRLIFRIRMHFDLSQEKFADRLGMKQESIARAESGSHISIATLQKICNEFDVVIKMELDFATPSLPHSK